MSSPISEVAPASAVNPAYVATEETFEGWGVGDNAEAALDQPEPEEAIEEEEPAEVDEEDVEEETEEEVEENEEEEEVEEEAEEEVAEVEETPEEAPPPGKRAQARIRELIEERKALEARIAALETKNSNDRIAQHLEEQLAMQRQAFEYATQQRQEQERLARENSQFEVLRARGYEPGNFAHELAIENMRKIDEFIATMQPTVQTIDQRHAEVERQGQAREYLAQLTAHFDKALDGIAVKPELRSWLFETTKRLAIQHDATADEAVQLAFKEANSIGILPKREPAKKVEPKTKPPKHVIEAVAKKGNRAGRKPGKQTKNRGRRNPEDDAFPETSDGEW